MRERTARRTQPVRVTDDLVPARAVGGYTASRLPPGRSYVGRCGSALYPHRPCVGSSDAGTERGVTSGMGCAMQEQRKDRRRPITRPMLPLLNQLGYVFTPYAWLGHVLLGLVIQAVAAVPLRLAGVAAAWWIGAALSAGFWWGREKVEYEFALRNLAGLRTLAPFWWRGWLPFDWGWSSAAEFLAPTTACLLLAWYVGRPAAARRGQQSKVHKR